MSHTDASVFRFWTRGHNDPAGSGAGVGIAPPLGRAVVMYC